MFPQVRSKIQDTIARLEQTLVSYSLSTHIVAVYTDMFELEGPARNHSNRGQGIRRGHYKSPRCTRRCQKS